MRIKRHAAGTMLGSAAALLFMVDGMLLAQDAKPIPQTPPQSSPVAPQRPAEPPAQSRQPTQPPARPPAAVTVLDTHDVQGILGREVLSASNENMGRIVDVLVDHSGQVRAAIIDFGGFLGVGSRKIAVEWTALHFPPPAQADAKITLALTRDQVKAAPEYQDGKPVTVLGALGKLGPLPFE